MSAHDRDIKPHSSASHEAPTTTAGSPPPRLSTLSRDQNANVQAYLGSLKRTPSPEPLPDDADGERSPSAWPLNLPAGSPDHGQEGDISLLALQGHGRERDTSPDDDDDGHSAASSLTLYRYPTPLDPPSPVGEQGTGYFRVAGRSGGKNSGRRKKWSRYDVMVFVPGSKKEEEDESEWSEGRLIDSYICDDGLGEEEGEDYPKPVGGSGMFTPVKPRANPAENAFGVLGGIDDGGESEVGDEDVAEEGGDGGNEEVKDNQGEGNRARFTLSGDEGINHHFLRLMLLLAETHEEAERSSIESPGWGLFVLDCIG